jgi:hypothetical protein
VLSSNKHNNRKIKKEKGERRRKTV